MPAIMMEEQAQKTVAREAQNIRTLATERQNEASEGLDTKSAL